MENISKIKITMKFYPVMNLKFLKKTISNS